MVVYASYTTRDLKNKRSVKPDIHANDVLPTFLETYKFTIF